MTTLTATLSFTNEEVTNQFSAQGFDAGKAYKIIDAVGRKALKGDKGYWVLFDALMVAGVRFQINEA